MSAHPQNGRLRGEWVAKSRNQEQRSYATPAHDEAYQMALIRLNAGEPPQMVVDQLRYIYASIQTQYV